MESLMTSLAALIRQQKRLETPRELTVDVTGAPACIVELADAMQHHAWDVSLGGFHLRDAGAAPLRDLGSTFETLEDELDHPLEDVLAEAGLDQGPFDVAATLELCPDGGGMSVLAVSWGTGAPTLVLLELDENPNEDGLLRHLPTPGAFFAFLEQMSGPPATGPDVDALRAAAIAAGADMEPSAPIVSRAL